MPPFNLKSPYQVFLIRRCIRATIEYKVMINAVDVPGNAKVSEQDHQNANIWIIVKHGNTTADHHHPVLRSCDTCVLIQV